MRDGVNISYKFHHTLGHKKIETFEETFHKPEHYNSNDMGSDALNIYHGFSLLISHLKDITATCNVTQGSKVLTYW